MGLTKIIYITKTDSFIVINDINEMVYPWQFETEVAADLFADLIETIGLKTHNENFMGNINWLASEEDMQVCWDNHKKEIEKIKEDN